MTVEELVQAKLAETAAEYRARGYDVIVNPAAGDVPRFLSGAVPDLIAKSDSDSVVVEVKALPAIESDRIVRIADAVAANPPWRFELVSAIPVSAPDVPVMEDLASTDHVQRLLQESELLLQQNHPEAAALIAWSAIEAILRRRAAATGAELERQSSSRLLTELYSIGEIERALYDRLLRLLEFRNAIAHGFRPRSAAPDIAQIVNDARELQRAA
jgi:hypothetical protein